MIQSTVMPTVSTAAPQVMTAQHMAPQTMAHPVPAQAQRGLVHTPTPQQMAAAADNARFARVAQERRGAINGHVPQRYFEHGRPNEEAQHGNPEFERRPEGQQVPQQAVAQRPINFQGQNR